MKVSGLGKILIGAGCVFIGIGLLLIFTKQLPWVGKLPGDIIIKKGHFTFYFPLTTCILLSLILSIVIRFISRK